jgi:hypothetical protein
VGGRGWYSGESFGRAKTMTTNACHKTTQQADLATSSTTRIFETHWHSDKNERRKGGEKARQCKVGYADVRHQGCIGGFSDGGLRRNQRFCNVCMERAYMWERARAPAFFAWISTLRLCIKSTFCCAWDLIRERTVGSSSWNLSLSDLLRLR